MGWQHLSRSKLEKFHDQQVVKEFIDAVENKEDQRIVLVRWRALDVEDTLDSHAKNNRTRISQTEVLCKIQLKYESYNSSMEETV